MKSEGIVVKITGSQCIVLTRDGTYQKLALTKAKNAVVGTEIEFSPTNWLDFRKPLLLVASILILVMSISLYSLTTGPTTFAYVSLDINPSVELEVDRNLKVVGVHDLNSDAATLLSGLELKGRDLYSSIRIIMDKAAASGYLKPAQENYVLSTITMNKDAANQINYDTVALNMSAPVKNRGLDAEIVIMSSDVKTHNEAKNQGLSAGKYIVYKNSVATGNKVSLQQIKQNSITKLVNVYKVRLLPDNKREIVKSVHIAKHAKVVKTEEPENKSPKNIEEDYSGDDKESVTENYTGAKEILKSKSNKHTDKNNNKEKYEKVSPKKGNEGIQSGQTQGKEQENEKKPEKRKDQEIESDFNRSENSGSEKKSSSDAKPDDHENDEID